MCLGIQNTILLFVRMIPSKKTSDDETVGGYAGLKHPKTKPEHDWIYVEI